MAKKASAKPAKAKSTRSQLLSYKDVQIAYLRDGNDGVQKLLADGQASKGAIRRALKAFETQGAAVSSFSDFVRTHIGIGKRGRAAPLVGSDREYRAQRLASGGTFLRLPLEALGVTKGGVVKVRFDGDKITIEKA